MVYLEKKNKSVSLYHWYLYFAKINKEIHSDTLHVCYFNRVVLFFFFLDATRISLEWHLIRFFMRIFPVSSLSFLKRKDFLTFFCIIWNSRIIKHHNMISPLQHHCKNLLLFIFCCTHQCLIDDMYFYRLKYCDYGIRNNISHFLYFSFIVICSIVHDKIKYRYQSLSFVAEET